MKIEIISKAEIKVNGILFTPSEEKPKPKKLKDEEHPLWPHFLKLWGEYGKKGNKKLSFNRLKQLKRTQREQMYTKVQDYVKSTPDKAFRKDLQTWLNKDKEYWNDSIIQAVDKFQKPVVGSASHKIYKKKDRPRVASNGLDRIKSIKRG